MNLHDKKIGIWGYGATGRATARFVAKQGAIVTVMDRTPQPDCPWSFILEKEETRDHFLREAKIIIPSPGIDIDLYHEKYRAKWLSELDLFATFNTTPVIAITGSLGKTSTTTLLSKLLPQYGLKIKTGGNIGTPMLNLLDHDISADYILLELSSFQLQYATRLCPTIAVITNLFENHLDRHGSMAHYIAAKSQIYAQQTEGQIAIAPLKQASAIRQNISDKHPFFFLSNQPPARQELDNNDVIFYLDGTQVVDSHTNGALVDLTTLPPVTFKENWLTIASVLHTLKLPLAQLASYARNLTTPPHRLERVPFRQGITVYNDSKSTTPTSTAAALTQLNCGSVTLFLGGLSKGVNRTPFIKTLSERVKEIYCFGAEAMLLDNACRKNAIPSHAFGTLEESWRHCASKLQAGDCILFSPAGSSFDLFKNYEERGNKFKALVAKAA